jgi:geranylgeranyl diphosphate synthase type I
MSQPEWMEELRGKLADRLEAFLAGKRREAELISPDSVELVEQVTSLTMRGGKRLRPIVLTAGYRAIRPTADADDDTTLDAGAAMELLQSYLLIHDDWMDLDDERRGGPSVFAALRDSHDDVHLGASLAVLAGDLASAYASELISNAPFPAARRGLGLDTFWKLQREVFFGQQLDLIASPDVERMYDLKTGSYTVRGPVILGAILADASDEAIVSLRAWANPVGIAFQLRDELLGTFGEPENTGKPAGGDIKQGKHTTLVKHARELVPESERGPLEDALGNQDASDAQVAAATGLLIQCGAQKKVEERLATLSANARTALAAAPFESTDLEHLTTLLIDRDR